MGLIPHFAAKTKVAAIRRNVPPEKSGRVYLMCAPSDHIFIRCRRNWHLEHLAAFQV